MERPYSFREFKPRAQAMSPRQRALAQWRRWDWSPEEKARQNSAQPVTGIMPQVLGRLRMERRLAEVEILKVWNHHLDPAITAHARPTGIHKGTLFVTVDSNVWLDEIVRYRRREILERLQGCFGREMIARISFRAG